jgi:hypothetical protein
MNLYLCSTEPLPGVRGIRLRISEAGQRLSWQVVVDGLARESGIHEMLTGAIRGTRWPAVFFECTPLRRGTLDLPFEAVVLDAPNLASLRPDPTPFRRVLDPLQDRPEVTTIRNVSGDAMLVVPAPAGPAANYTHLAAFLRTAADVQLRAFWRTTGERLQQHLDTSEEPVWLNTSGLGVAWTHLRLDLRPKYYKHAPFRKAP